MNEEHAKIIEEYLKKREENDVLKDFNRIDENKHKKALQESEITDIFGSTESIGNRLLTIKANIKSLLDPDIYEEKEKILLNFIQEEGEILPILGKKYKEII